MPRAPAQILHPPFSAMGYLESVNLQGLVEQHGILTPARALEYLTQVASDLDDAHANKDAVGLPAPIVHRDLKPSNLVLIDGEGGRKIVKIVDSGIAANLSGSPTVSLDYSEALPYVAPEMLSSEPVTPATDVWSIGLVAFFLLTGRCYWTSGQRGMPNVCNIFAEVRKGPTVLPSVRAQELGVDVVLPPAFDDWFIRCVNPDPMQRYQTAGEALRTLATALDPSAL